MTKQLLKSAAILTFVPLAIGCAAGADDPVDPGSDLEDALQAPRTFDLDLPDSVINAVAVALRDDKETPVDFEIVTGQIEVMAYDGVLSVTDIDIELADVTIPEEILPPRGLVLTDMRVELDAPASAEAEWTTDGRRVDATITVDLTVEWAMLRDGESHPLGDVRVETLPISIGVTRDGDGLDLSLGADRDGRFWAWAETFELRDLELELAALR